MSDAKTEKMCLGDFGYIMEELFRRWRAVPPIVDDDFEERYYEFRQQIEKVWKMPDMPITREERDLDLPPEWYFEDDRYTLRHQAFDDGFTHACAMLARMLDAEKWELGDGSESWEGDASNTISNILEAAGVYDPESGAIASHKMNRSALTAAEGDIARLKDDLASADRATSERIAALADAVNALDHALDKTCYFRLLKPTIASEIDATRRRARAALEGK